MKLFLDFELCEECNSFIADLTREDSLLLDDVARNEIQWIPVRIYQIF